MNINNGFIFVILVFGAYCYTNIDELVSQGDLAPELLAFVGLFALFMIYQVGQHFRRNKTAKTFHPGPVHEGKGKVSLDLSSDHNFYILKRNPAEM